ncbi:MAG: hypothetical protein V2A78_05700 [bacterium]
MKSCYNCSLRHIFLVLVFSFWLPAAIMGCGGSSSGPGPNPSPTPDPSEISRITEISSTSKNIEPATGGTVTHGELAVTLLSGALPGSSTIKVSRVAVSNSTQAPSLQDLTGCYVVSTTSSTEALELTDAAALEFVINPSGFDSSNIQMVFWDGYEWLPLPATYDETRHVVSIGLEEILPYGTRIYVDAGGGVSSGDNEELPEDGEIVQEFVALKIVGDSTAKKGATWIKTSRFSVCYTLASDKTLAESVSTYLEHACTTEVQTMGFRLPNEPAIPMPPNPSGRNWPVYIKTLTGNAAAYAYSTNYIEINRGQEIGDYLSATCHHEFFHLVQYAYTFSSPGWFDEATADAIGYYTCKGEGIIYSTANATMGHFEAPLDYFQALTDGDKNYQYDHYSFYSYILGKYGSAKFKSLFETFATSSTMNMSDLNTAASSTLSKTLVGRDGLYWEFYKDYFISGNIFYKDKFLNLSWRPSGTPFNINSSTAEQQGATLVEVNSETSYQKEFTVKHLSGQVAVLRFAGTAPDVINMTFTVNSSPGQAAGHIQIHTFKSVDGVLQPTGTPEEVSDGTQKQLNYTMGAGNNIFEVDVVMTNTSLSTDGYKVTVGAQVQ